MGRRDYLGLGVIPEFPNSYTVESAFNNHGVAPTCWLWKTLFTSITLGTGFKGGEVTPLFYIGACLGNLLSFIILNPVTLFAALGFIGIFSAATKTPLASTFLGIELFGISNFLLFLITCYLASCCNRKRRIYK